MEDVLDVYQMPRDPDVPLGCLDEASKQLLQDTRTGVPMKPGQPARHDYEYERHGTSNLFMFFAPLDGWRHVKVTDQRTASDYAHALKDLAEKHFPEAKQIRLVQDNLNTHKPASLYEAFPAEQARQLVKRFTLYAQARQLAQHGRVRDRRPHPPMSRPSYRRPQNPRQANRGMAKTAEQTSRQSAMAVHNRRCTHQAQDTVSNFLDDSDH